MLQLFCCYQTAKTRKCAELLLGQYRCDDPLIDDRTQEPEGCERVYYIADGEEKFLDTAPVICHSAPQIQCEGGTFNETLDAYVFKRTIPCRWTNGKNYRLTLFLSLFFGKIRVNKVIERMNLINFCFSKVFSVLIEFIWVIM